MKKYSTLGRIGIICSIIAVIVSFINMIISTFNWLSILMLFNMLVILGSNLLINYEKETRNDKR
jgi:hypothetical protein